MNKNRTYNERLSELIADGNGLLNTRTRGGGEKRVVTNAFGGRQTSTTPRFDRVNQAEASAWGTRVLTFLEQAFGEASPFYKSFAEHHAKFPLSTNFHRFHAALTLLSAAEKELEHIQVASPVVTESEADGKNMVLAIIEESSRNTRVYLLGGGFLILTLLGIVFVSTGFIPTAITGFVLALTFYLIGSITLKEWSLTKLPERISELEQRRLAKRFSTSRDETARVP
jgi:hypothetical protein